MSNNQNIGFDPNDGAFDDPEAYVAKNQTKAVSEFGQLEDNGIEPDFDAMNRVADDEPVVDEQAQKLISEESISDAEDIPTANATGRDNANNKKLKMAAVGVAGMLVALVGAGMAVGKFQENREAKRIAEAEAAAQEQRQVANGAARDLSQDMNVPPPSALSEMNGMEDSTAEDLTAETNAQPLPSVPNMAYEPSTTPSPAPYVPVANSVKAQDSWIAGIDYPAPATIPTQSPAPESTMNFNPEPAPIVEYKEPPLKGSQSGVLVDVSALRKVSASSNNSDNGDGKSQVGGNLSPTRLQSAAATRSGDTTYQLLRGATIPCVLETKIVSTYQGFTRCRITRDVYSSNGKTVLLDRGTRVFGEQNVQIQQGQARVAILWTHAETPKGVSINLDSPAVGQLGEMGVGAKVNNHFWKRFGGAIMLSMIQDAIDVGTSRLDNKNDSGNNNTTVNNTSNTAQSMAEQALSGTINIPPTATINQGTMLQIMVARDVDFSGVYVNKRHKP